MKNIKKIELRVGVVSLIATILLILGIILGRGYKVSVSMQTIKFRFPNSGGLQISSPVVVNGVKRGTVSSIKNDGGSVLVEAVIDNTKDLRSDARARITILEITGGKKIEIYPGSSADPLDIKNEIPGETASDFAVIVSELGEILKETKVVMGKLDRTLTSTNKLLEDKQFLVNTKEALENANQALRISREILESNQISINQTLQSIRDISTKLQSDYYKYEPKVQSIINNLETISSQTKIILNQGNSTLKTLDKAVSEIIGIVDEIKQGSNLVHKLIYDKELSQQLDSTLTNLTKFLNQVQKYGVNVNLRLGTRP
ncbi:MAG: MlaD family protein [Candidatus Kapaibacteriota bacterium]